jgi:hypothetical protein
VRFDLSEQTREARRSRHGSTPSTSPPGASYSRVEVGRPHISRHDSTHASSNDGSPSSDSTPQTMAPTRCAGPRRH